MSLCFNSCPHAEGNPSQKDETYIICRFNSCPHAEGNLAGVALTFQVRCFNSCPHAEGNSKVPVIFDDLFVSIRALTRRATRAMWSMNDYVPVSIRALTRRATGRLLKDTERLSCFNSCPHAEGNVERSKADFFRNVSIRALTRRATRCSCGALFGILFQFVPSRGGQPRKIVKEESSMGFNSCPHAEGNLLPVAGAEEDGVSIRALTRRATYCRRSGARSS